MRKSSFSILINTCDNFEDCWMPFFTLFKNYWPDYSGKIYLNTETKSFEFPGLNIISIKNNVQTPDKKITWSECLIIALKTIDCEIILYMQEDYFLKDYVKTELVEKYVDLMTENKDIHCVHLTDQAIEANLQPSEYENLYPAILNQRYLISCQAALWRKDILFSCLRPYEDAWQFEEFGSKRGAILRHNIFVVDKNWVKLDEFEIIPYIFTGIIQGRWYNQVPPLFEKNGILMDFTKRGFLDEMPYKSISKKLIHGWKHLIVSIKYYSELYCLIRSRKNND